jgi:transcriptional regulator with XRE-family HTH domain
MAIATGTDDPHRIELSRVLSSGPFPDALRTAIRLSGLSLDRIQHRLQVRGVTVSVATLSYWQSGRRQPERAESLQALGQLEAVLGVPAGRLCALLGPPRPRGRRRSSASLPIEELWSGREPISGLLNRIDTSSDTQLARLSQHDRITVGPDKQQHSVQVHQVLRAERDGPDRWVLLYEWEPPAGPEPVAPKFSGLRNCRLGRVAVDHGTSLLAAELLFDRPLVTGETLIMEYTLTNPAPKAERPADEYLRKFRLPVREYVVEAQFDPERRPVRCQQYSAPAGTASPRLTNLPIAACGEAHAVALDAEPGEFGIRWEW